jgi:hypothetical protein
MNTLLLLTLRFWISVHDNVLLSITYWRRKRSMDAPRKGAKKVL